MSLLVAIAILFFSSALVNESNASGCCGCCCPCCCCKPIIIKLPPPPCKVCPCCCGCCGCGGGGGGRKRRSVGDESDKKSLSGVLLPDNNNDAPCSQMSSPAVQNLCSQIPPNERGPICAQVAGRNPFAPRPSDFGRAQRCAGCQGGCVPCTNFGGNLRKAREVSFTMKDAPFKHEKLHDDVPEIDSLVKSQSTLPSDQDRTHQVLFRNNLEVVVKEENKSNL